MEIALIIAAVLVLGVVGFFIGGCMAIKSSPRHSCSRCLASGRSLTNAGRSDKVLP